ncbi:MAG: glycosyltransferase [Candidatus Omnitrophota bacterium]
MNKRKRVLIFYITEHSGHHSAALAVEKALTYSDPDCQVLCVNAFRYTFPILERVVHSLYLLVIKRVPIVWERIYDNQNFFQKSQIVKRIVNRIGGIKIKRLINSYEPDVIVCTQAFPCGMVASYKKNNHDNLPLIGVLTDFAPHSFWIYDQVDYFIVPAEESKKMFIEKGVAAKKLLSFGIPINQKFSAYCDRISVIKQYGLREDVPVVLVMGGGRGLGPIKALVGELDNLKTNLQILVVCGVNVHLYRWIQKRVFKKKIVSFQFTDQVERLMTIASIVITKPGGITTAEALAKKCPMIILNPIPGQEARNTDFLVTNKVALKINSPEEVGKAIDCILTNPDCYNENEFVGSCRHFARPESSLELAGFVLHCAEIYKTS